MRFVIGILCIFGQVLAQAPCTRKDLEQGRMVFVCNESHSDTFNPIQKSAKGIVQVFTSTKSGKRFQKTETKFNENKTLNGNKWNVKVDRKRKYQKIIGFGGAFTDATVLGIGKLSPKLQKQIISDLFSESGLEYSVARTTISGSDFSARPYSYDDTENDWELKNFSLADEDIKYRIPQMKMAMEVAKNKSVKFYGSSWSSPTWLKTNHEYNHGGTLLEGPGSMTWKTYANYLVKWLQSYRNHGIEFWGMTVQNEPITGLDSGFSWNTLMFTPEMERDFVKTDLGPALEKAGWGPDKLNLMIMDHNRDLLPRWPEVVLSDKDAAKYIKGISVHWYANNLVGPEVIDQIHQKFPDYFILATEACDARWGSPIPKIRVSLGEWDFGTNYANDIIRDLTHWTIGWVDWNMVLDTKGGPNWAKNYASAPIIVNPAANEYYKNPQFYALGHFSKFLTPGTQRVGIIPEIVDIVHFQIGLFERSDGGNVFIVINGLSEQQAVIVDDPDFGQLKMQIEPKSFNTWVYYP